MYPEKPCRLIMGCPVSIFSIVNSEILGVKNQNWVSKRQVISANYN